MGEKHWPLADDHHIIAWCYMQAGLMGVLGYRVFCTKRRWVPFVRMANWGVPLGFFGFVLCYDALPKPVKRFVWSMGTDGELPNSVNSVKMLNFNFSSICFVFFLFFLFVNIVRVLFL